MTKAREIAENMRQRIRTGEFPVGAPFPAVWTMSSEYGVSDGTAHRALNILRDEGTVRVAHGVPSVVIAVPDAEGRSVAELLAAAKSAAATLTSALDELDARLAGE